MKSLSASCRSALSQLVRFFRSVSFPKSWSPLAVVSGGILILGLSACSARIWPDESEGCNSRTYINAVLPEYLKARFPMNSQVRIAVLPFDVPETFARPGNESDNFGRVLAQKVQAELARTGEVGILEMFNIDRFPGKREEFFAGNYSAIQFARNAGYDMAILGYLEELKNDEEMNLFAKIIDVSDGTTVYYGKIQVYSRERSWRKALSKARLVKDQPPLFHFADRADKLASCTVDHIINENPVP